MSNDGWLVEVFDLDGSWVADRPCPSGDAAKTWGRYLTRGVLRHHPSGVRVVIRDPRGAPWKVALVTPRGSWRIRWFDPDAAEICEAAP